jgi:magnesium and cobalt exporter, CNNM family
MIPLALTAPPLSPWLSLSLGLLLILLNGFFVAAEFALVKLRPTQVEGLAARGHRRAQIARHMLRHIDAYLSASQLGITLASLGLGWIGEGAFSWVVEPVVMRLPGASPALVHTVGLTLSFTLITVLHIVIGEQAPKSFAIRKSERTALWIAFPLWAFYKVTYPAIYLLNHASIGLLRLFGMKPAAEGELAHSEEELRLLLASHEHGGLSPQKSELLDNVFELSHRLARQIMVPRGDVVYLSTTRPVQDNLEIARRSRHTRFPLCEGDLDKVVGQVHIKDLFGAETPLQSLREVARDIPFIPETLSLDRLLKRMRAERIHLAAVLDEYGGVSGIVTLENVMEEIVGPIQDEFSAEKPELVARGDNVYQVSGSMLVADLEHELKIEFSDRDEDTIAGVVLSELGRRARPGDQVEVGPLQIEVLEVQGNRIRSLRVTLLQPAAVPADGE